MRIISFDISGKTAFFKKPDVNAYAYFTYNNIHKPALLGLLGAILGFGGHNQLFEKNKKIEEENKKLRGKNKKKRDEGFPEYYEALKNLKISVVPLTKQGYFSKKIHVFNNSVGYASKEQGGNLIVREQWLENPSWRILLLDDNKSVEKKLFNKLEDYLVNRKTEFIPYLGKNDHPATIDNVLEFNGGDFSIKDTQFMRISSLFFNDAFILSSFPPRKEKQYLHKEMSPVRLKERLHIYEYESIAFTNFKMELKPDCDKDFKLISTGDDVFFFF